MSAMHLQDCSKSDAEWDMSSVGLILTKHIVDSTEINIAIWIVVVMAISCLVLCRELICVN